MEGNGSSTVLVVEDQPAVRRLICLELERQGHAVLRAFEPVEALALVMRVDRPIDLVVTDLALPRGSAAGLLESMSELGLDPPVLYVSGYGDAPPDLPGRRTLFLAKPFSLAQLASAVAELLGH